MKITETAVRAALAAPALFADDLVAILNDRGARDAALVITAQSGDWERLRTAAATAGRAASATPDVSIAGPLVAFAAAAWATGTMDDELLALLASVPESDPARRMATLMLRCITQNVPAASWAAGLSKRSVAECLAFGAENRATA